MAWENVDLTSVNPNMETIPVGDYTFTLGGAKYGDNDPGRIEVNATIATEGDFTGRKMFFSYPDYRKPKCEWSLKMVKRLEVALGIDAMAGEDPVSYLNRAAGNKFGATVKLRPKQTNTVTGEEYPERAELDIFKVRAAA